MHDKKSEEYILSKRVQRRYLYLEELVGNLKSKYENQSCNCYHPYSLACRLCKIKLHDMMTAVVMLRDLQTRGLITEVSKGIWMRSPGAAQDKNHGTGTPTFLKTHRDN